MTGTRVTILGTVLSRRGHGALSFVTVGASGEWIQLAVAERERQSAAVLLRHLALRPGSRLRASGRLDCSRKGELTVFADAVAVTLESLPGENAVAVFGALQMIEAGVLTATAAAAALGCSMDALAEVKLISIPLSLAPSAIAPPLAHPNEILAPTPP